MKGLLTVVLVAVMALGFGATIIADDFGDSFLKNAVQGAATGAAATASTPKGRLMWAA